MPLYTPGGLQLGPRAASGPSSMPAYLASIGKASWYGGFRAPLLLYSDIANTLAVTTEGAAWANWLANWSAGGFSSYFTQTTGTNRPALGLSRNGKPGVYGDGIAWWSALNSTTELNRQHTVLVSAWVKCAVGPPCLYSQNNQAMRFTCPVSTSNTPLILASKKSGSNVNYVMQSTPVDATTYACRVGWSTEPTSTQHHNAVPNLFRSSSNANYSDSTIHELWYVPWLTPDEITGALPFLL